jgi:hypothetical protein
MKTPRWAVLGLACGMTPPLLLAFGCPPGLALLGGVAVGVLGIRLGAGTAWLLVLSGVASLAVYAALLRLSGLEDAIYYRPHERYATWDARHGHRAYQPDISVRMHVPHGDLQALTREPIAEPRDVTFRTDADGFRNDTDYAGESWVLLGDSFIAGNGTAQEDLLQRHLAERDVRAYNRGFPGGITDYEQFWRSSRARSAESGAVLFLFEGNDFPERVGRRERSPWRTALDRRIRNATAAFRTLPTWRVTRSLAARVARLGSIRAGAEVEVHELAGLPLAFYAPYVRHTRGEALVDMDGFDASFGRLAPRLRAVFFIPTKYRVYQPWISPEEALPNASWRHLAALCAARDLPCFDLTAALRRRAAELLARKRFIWWRDDTHWNGAGIEAAAERVAEALGAIGSRG